MRTPDEYREFAAECYRWAAEAKTEMYQKMMEEMARAWSEVAEELETKIGYPVPAREQSIIGRFKAALKNIRVPLWFPEI
jgi:hypothetical protein